MDIDLENGFKEISKELKEIIEKHKDNISYHAARDFLKTIQEFDNLIFFQNGRKGM